MIRKLVLLFLLISVNNIYSQNKKKITLEDIWQNYTYYPASHPGFNSLGDGVSYSQTEENGDINRYDVATGALLGNLVKSSELIYQGLPLVVEDFSFSTDESKMLISTNETKVYRYSKLADFFVFDLKTKKLSKLTTGAKQMFATFSPIGNKVAFVRENNIFVKDLDNQIETQVTKDGELNKIKNGWSDWVYEEEFSVMINFFWNDDASKIAYIRFDESKVKEFEMAIYGTLYPRQEKFKYPKAGEDNSIVSVHIYDLASAKTINADIGTETNIYIPRIIWTKDKNTLSVQRMNRLQNKLELLLTDATTGTSKVILTEESKTYIEITDDLKFLDNNKGFITSSERDGYNHLYHYDLNGKLIKQITSGNWDIISFKGYDSASNTLFYISTEIAQTDRDLYSISLDGSNKKRLSKANGTTDAEFTVGFKYYVNTWSDANTPPTIDLCKADGKPVKALEGNPELRKILSECELSKKEFFKFKTTDNVELNGWMIKPTNFDAKKKYPVFMFAYGGPGNNECNNNYETWDYPWHQMLAQNGYVVVCVDGRGTFGRGREFKHSTYLQLGKYEAIDQIETAKYLSNLPYVNKEKIGFMGWSFGGYLASILATKGNGIFKACIAVAPVTNWRYYDNIYTERFMRTPQENASGYDSNSPINFVKDLKGKFLLIHGTADDNVHFQNSMEMVDKLVEANIPFEFMAYPNKNHGIIGGNTRLHLYNKMFKFVKDNL